MMESKRNKSIINFVKNFVYNFLSSALPTVILQFVVQPVLARYLGSETFGQYLTLMSLNFFIIAVTSAVLNTVRMLQDEEYQRLSIKGDFNIFLVAYAIIVSVVMPIGWVFYTKTASALDIILYVLIGYLYLYHDYIFSQYRLRMQFSKILINNIILVIGYFLGLLIFTSLIHRWQIVVITAYFLGFIYDFFNTDFIKEPVKKTVETPAPKKVETPKPKTQTQPKKEPAKASTTSKPAATQTPAEPVEYALDPMEAFAKQTKQTAKKEFDWSSFDDDEEETSATTPVKTVQSDAPAFSGSAGTAASSSDSKVTSSSNSSKNSSQSASSSTSSALQGIKNSTFKGNAANGVQSETNAKAKTSGSGKVEIEMSNGRSRALIKPASPVINLSAQAAATIDASITVSISFKVNEKGNVSGVIISPSSAFKEIVKQEITGQLLDWLFEPADYTATATFDYIIVKR